MSAHILIEQIKSEDESEFLVLVSPLLCLTSAAQSQLTRGWAQITVAFCKVLYPVKINPNSLDILFFRVMFLTL